MGLRLVNQGLQAIHPEHRHSQLIIVSLGKAHPDKNTLIVQVGDSQQGLLFLNTVLLTTFML